MNDTNDTNDTNDMNPSDLSLRALFTQYIDVVNRAIDARGDGFPQAQISALREKLLDGRTVDVAVYKDDASQIYDHHTVTFKSGKLDYVQHGKPGDDIDFTWKMPQAHLERVASEPQDFIDPPTRLKLDWLENRVAGSN